MQNHQVLVMSTTEVQVLQESLKQLHKQFEAFAETQDRIEYKLSGNPLDREDKGMIGQLREVVQDVEELKLAKKRIGWSIAGFMFAGSIFYAIIQIAVNYFSNHQH